MVKKLLVVLVAVSMASPTAASAAVRFHKVKVRPGTQLPLVPRAAKIRNRAPRAHISALSPADQSTFSTALDRARAARDALPVGTPRDELSGVIANAQQIEARGDLTPSRVAAVTLILDRNTDFWPANPVPTPGSRFTFGTSPVIFEYYRGEGLQIQPLANFGKANAAWRTCKNNADSYCPNLRAMLDAMLRIASQRGGFTTWEYYFDFEGGVPPWTSGMSQGTAVQAFSRGYKLTGEIRYRDAGAAALGAFETAPPVGVATPATNGTHYLMYSYAPKLFIFNGFFQALVGLYDYKSNTGDTRGTALFRAGDPHARWLTPQSDTGSWSLYSLNGPLSNVNYHTLLRDILHNLCTRTGATVYCSTADRFTSYLAAQGG